MKLTYKAMLKMWAMFRFQLCGPSASSETI
jgi:hypothetical protein